MSSDAPEKVRRKILFLSGLLGFMVGVGAFLVFAVVQKGNYTLLVVLLPMLITSIPLAKALVQLRRVQAGAARPEVPSPGTRTS